MQFFHSFIISIFCLIFILKILRYTMHLFYHAVSKHRVFQLRLHQHQLKQTYRTSGPPVSIKLPLKPHWIGFSGLTQHYSVDSHFLYNTVITSCHSFCHILPFCQMLLVFNVWFFFCIQIVLCTFLYLIHLVLGSSFHFAEVIRFLVLPSAVFAILLLHDISHIQFYHPNSSMKILGWICSGYIPSTSNPLSV